MSDEELQNRVFREDNAIYYLHTDLNDENVKLLKKKAMTESE